MRIDIAGRHFDLTDGLREHILHRIGKLEKYSLNLISIHVICEVQKIHHICEITVQGPQVKSEAKANTPDMYQSFDKALANLQHQLAKLHEKRVEHRGGDQ